MFFSHPFFVLFFAPFFLVFLRFLALLAPFLACGLIILGDACSNPSRPLGAEARQRFVISWGCCSFDDPRSGLRKLGLMPEEK